MTALATLDNHPTIPSASILSLNRPDLRNALSIELLAGLHSCIDTASSRKDLTVLVLTGAGKAFCAGMDLKQVLGDPHAPLQLLSSLADLTLKIRRLAMVVVAKVNGAAIGGGCGLACVCDFAVTHADSKMGFPEVDLGVCPAVVAPWLVRRIGAGRARRVLLGGGLLSGREAFELGIVTDVVDSREALDARTDELVARLSSGGPAALRATKALLNDLDGSMDEAAVRRGAELSASVLLLPEAQESLRRRLSP
ncbi:MAG: enoyl-CoA hydratase/isomerase family protein [Phycisphaeraceae bacterium]|nr:enoyl-CoA hydratase/isomerase family protein [Phycisphaeraceae bacterium]